MQENIKTNAKNIIKNKDLEKMLRNIAHTDKLLNEFYDKRDKLRLRLAREDIIFDDGKYVSGSDSGLSAILSEEAQKLDDLIMRTTKKLISRQRSATYLINSISDYRLRLVLIKRYIDNKSVETIAEEMNYSPRHTQRMLKEASELIEKAYEYEKKKRENAQNTNPLNQDSSHSDFQN